MLPNAAVKQGLPQDRRVEKCFISARSFLRQAMQGLPYQCGQSLGADDPCRNPGYMPHALLASNGRRGKDL